MAELRSAKIQRAQVLLQWCRFIHLHYWYCNSEIDDPEQPSEEPTHWVDDLTDDGALLYSDVDDEF